jgi:Fe-S oxidoreductase
LWTASKAQKPFADNDGLIRHLPLFFSDMVKFRSLPAIADKPFRDQFETLEQPSCDRKAIFYAGCLIDFAYPNTGEAVVKTLNAAGVEVLFPQGQTCCGAPARYAGDYKTAIKNAKDNINAMDIESVDYVVSACPTCTVALKNDFEKALADDPDWLSRAKSLSDKVMDYSSLILNLRREGRIKLAGVSGDITYHDSCHLKRSLNAESQPRELLTGVGYKINEMAERDVCCGMGGSYTLKFPQISAPILAKKLDNIEATSTPMVAMDCPGCMMQIRGGLDKRDSQVKVAHTAELLAKLLEKSDSSE